MGVLFGILGSGSKGNSAYVEVDGDAFLIDLGLGPRVTDWRLREIGRSWGNVRSVLVSHCHGDHVHGPTLAHAGKRETRLFLHRDHHAYLGGRSECRQFENDGRLHVYDGGSFGLAPNVAAEPIRLPHDVPTRGFRIECRGSSGRVPIRVGYASDLGHVDGALVEAMADCDLLALEFNHDVEMEIASGRDPTLIERVLGPCGHLSNEQAAEGLERILRSSRRRVPRHLVLLHLSEDCNEERLALRAARDALDRLGLAGKVTLHVGRQREAGPLLTL